MTKLNLFDLVPASPAVVRSMSQPHHVNSLLRSGVEPGEKSDLPTAPPYS